MTTPRIAVVTGGLGGLGRAICHALLAAGHRPIAADRAAATSGIEDGVIAEVLDVSDFAACQAFARRIEAEHGAIDILVNNAGITRDATLRKMAPGAGDVSRQVERQLPRAMGAMAGMSTAIAGMLPQLRDIAERMREALPDDRLAEVPRAVD